MQRTSSQEQLLAGIAKINRLEMSQQHHNDKSNSLLLNIDSQYRVDSTERNTFTEEK
jgi:hypothetical protein